MEEFYKIIDGYIKKHEDMNFLCLNKTLFLVRCCGIKSKFKVGLSKDIYIYQTLTKTFIDLWKTIIIIMLQ